MLCSPALPLPVPFPFCFLPSALLPLFPSFHFLLFSWPALNRDAGAETAHHCDNSFTGNPPEALRSLSAGMQRPKLHITGTIVLSETHLKRFARFLQGRLRSQSNSVAARGLPTTWSQNGAGLKRSRSVPEVLPEGPFEPPLAAKNGNTTSYLSRKKTGNAPVHFKPVTRASCARRPLLTEYVWRSHFSGSRR